MVAVSIRIVSSSGGQKQKLGVVSIVLSLVSLVVVPDKMMEVGAVCQDFFFSLLLLMMELSSPSLRLQNFSRYCVCVCVCLCVCNSMTAHLPLRNGTMLSLWS